MENEKIILAYSGGLDTSIAIKWLEEHSHYQVIAMIADVGEGKDLNLIRAKALDIGALDCHLLNLKKEYANNYLSKALKANALYEGVYPLISALSRPLIAQKLIKLAETYQATAVAHGCTGKGNDQVRFDVALKALNPSIKIVAPFRASPMSREYAFSYAEKHQIPLPIQKDNPFSIDKNLWGRSCECGILEDPEIAPPEEAFELTLPLNQTPDKADVIEIEFEQGLPTHLNGEAFSFERLILNLNSLAGKHGIGRIDHIENRLVGIKSREIYEAPAAITLITAHQALESLCLTKDMLHFKPILEQKFAQLVYDGLWFSPLFEAINAFIDQTQQNVTGKVSLELFKGHAKVIGRSSFSSLYQPKLATYQEEDTFSHQAAEGFIELFGLPLQIHALVNKG